MKCDFCGYENISEAEFCVNCGNHLVQTSSAGRDAAIGSSPDDKPPQKKKGKAGLVIGIVSGALTLFIVAGVALGIILFQMNRNTTHAATVSGNITSIADVDELPEDTAGCDIILYQEHAQEPYRQVTPDKDGNFNLDAEPGVYYIVIRYPDGSESEPKQVDIPNDGDDEKDIEDVIVDPTAGTEPTETESPETKATASEEEKKTQPVYTADNSVVECGDTVYFVDKNGLSSLKNDKKKTLHECKAKNLATDGKTIYYGVFLKEKKDSTTKITWNQFDLYRYEISTAKKEKVLSFNECGRPIGVVDGKLYYTDYPDDFDGNCAGLAQSLYVYDLNAKSKKLLSKGASEFDLYGNKIYFKDMTAAAIYTYTQLKCYDMEKDEVKQITRDGIVDFVRVDGMLYYSTQTHSTGSDSNETCRLFSNDIATNKEKLLFEKKGKNLMISDFDDKVIIYRVDPDEIHRYTIKTKKDEVISLADGSTIPYRDGSRTLFSAYKGDKLYEVKDNGVSVTATYGVPEGTLLKVCRNYAFMMAGDNFYFHDIKYQKLKAESDAVEPTKTVDTGAELFSKFTENFVFTSGVGGWGTTLKIEPDGSFTGVYSDSNMGERGDDYPNGTMYTCSFSGHFSAPEKVNEYTYSMKLLDIRYDREPGEEEIIDGRKIFYTEPYGMEGVEEMLIYTPEARLGDLPEEYLSWVFRMNDDPDEKLGCYGLYNPSEKQGFSSSNK